MSSRVCPKCGHSQNGGTECTKCGIIFDKYSRYIELERPEPEALLVFDPGPGLVRQVVRVFRWIVPIPTLLLFVLALRPADAPEIPQDPQGVMRIERKILQSKKSARGGKPFIIELNQAEVNSWLRTKLNLSPSKGGAHSPGSDEAHPDAGQETANLSHEDGPSVVRDLKVEMLKDGIRAYMQFGLCGRSISLQVEGRPVVKNRHLHLEPRAGQIGLLPVPGPTLERAVAQMFDSPESRDRLRLPPEVQDIRVEDGNLQIVYR